MTSPRLRFTCLAILGLMLAPIALAAAASPGQALTLAAFGAIPFLREEKKNEEENEGGGEKKPEETQLTLGQRLSAALSSKNTLQARITQLETENGNLTRQVGDLTRRAERAEQKLKEAETQLGEVKTALEGSEKEVKELASKEQDIEKRTEQKTKEKISSLGFPANKLPAPSERSVGAGDLESAIKEMESEKDPVKRGKLLSKVEQLRAEINDDQPKNPHGSN